MDSNLVKTVNFKKHNYIGDPINTVRIFNELEVDELCFLDIRSTVNKTAINYNLLSEISKECFMPLSYGGGVNNFEQAQKIFGLGFEKIVINSASFEHPDLIRKIADQYGSQSVIGSMDVKKSWLGGQRVYRNSGNKKTKYTPLEWAKKLEEIGVGEILLTSIDKEGTWSGFDIDLVKSISENVSVPVIAQGGAGNIEHIREVFHKGGAQAVGLGSMVVYQKQGMGVLINFSDRSKLIDIVYE